VKRAKRVERRPKDTQEAEQDDAGNGTEPTLLMINRAPERLERSESLGVKEEPPKEQAFRSVRVPAQAQQRGLRGVQEERFVNGALPFTAKRVKGHALTMRRKRSKRARKNMGSPAHSNETK